MQNVLSHVAAVLKKHDYRQPLNMNHVFGAITFDIMGQSVPFWSLSSSLPMFCRGKEENGSRAGVHKRGREGLLYARRGPMRVQQRSPLAEGVALEHFS